MSKLITDYIKVYSNYTEDDLDLITDHSENFRWEDHKWSGYKEDRGSRDKNEFEVSYPPKSVLSFVKNKNLLAVGDYLKEFPLCTFNDISPVRFNKYTENTNMAMHVDHIRSLFDGERKGIPILTVLTVFTDQYKGGEFVFNEDDEYKLKAGDTIVFPSVFLYAHRVNTVTEGIRLSCVAWTW